MKTKLLLLAFLTSTLLLFGQSKTQISGIRKKVEAINLEKNYTIKKLDNTYFTEVKDELTDGGQELTGFYKNGELRKISYSIGRSQGNATQNYYFADNQLIFVFEHQSIFPLKKGQSAELDFTTLRPVFEGRYYFAASRLIKTKESGTRIFTSNPKYQTADPFLKDSKRFRQELKSQK